MTHPPCVHGKPSLSRQRPPAGAEARHHNPIPPRPHLTLPTPGSRRAVVVGAGSFGTAVAVLLARGGFRTTLQTRTAEQAQLLQTERENRIYLPGIEFPRELRVEPVSEGLMRADYVFLGVPSRGLDEVIGGLPEGGLR